MRLLLKLLLVVLLGTGVTASGSSLQVPDAPANLRCEGFISPHGIGVPAPRLSWIVPPSRGILQTGFQILVATKKSLLSKDQADLWNSGKVASSNSIGTPYGGKTLTSGEKCFWKVRIWDDNGKASPWSKPDTWTVGLLTSADWQGAQWIGSDLKLKPYQAALKTLTDFGMEPETEIWSIADSLRKIGKSVTDAPAVYLRKEVTLSKTVTCATAYICGLGFFELSVNGKKVGDHLLDPAFTDYEKRVEYQAFDVTSMLVQGKNALGVILGNGWYNLITPHVLRFYAADYINTPRLLFRLAIEYADGSRESVLSGPDWHFTTSGPIRFNCVLAGETYDATMEMPGWDKPRFSASDWKEALLLDAPHGKLVRQMLHPVRKQEQIPAVRVEKKDSVWRFDLGVETAGWARVRVHGTRGQKLTIRLPGAPSHTLGRYQTEELILSGKGTEVYEPRFCYAGFQYIDIEGLTYQPKPSDVTGIAISSDMPSAGRFTCSDERLNRLQEILRRTVRNYVIQIPNDPTREKAGWTQDVESGFYQTAYNFDAFSMYVKWQRDFMDEVHPNGYMPPVAPGRFDGPTINGPWWGGVIIYHPWILYQFYGDTAILAESYPVMKSYFGWLRTQAKDHLISWGLGDWLEVGAVLARPKHTPVPLTSTAAYCWFAQILNRTATLLGKAGEARQFELLADSIRVAYNQTFFNPQTGAYASGSQTSQLISLMCGLVPEDKKDLVRQELFERIGLDKNHLTTGFVGTPVLLPMLAELGRPDLAWSIATQTDYPSFIDAVLNRNNTVMKEDWNGGLVQMPSLQGPIGTWFYHSLAGIRMSDEAPGFKKLIIHPETAGTLSWVKASHVTPYGEIRSSWRREKGRFKLDVEIPGNSSATVYLPAKTASAITEGNVPLDKVSGVRLLRVEPGRAVIDVGAGVYKFEADEPDGRAD
jgi:alpha-L-rhamnosidase